LSELAGFLLLVILPNLILIGCDRIWPYDARLCLITTIGSLALVAVGLITDDIPFMIVWLVAAAYWDDRGLRAVYLRGEESS
jgi:hypothetical protein